MGVGDLFWIFFMFSALQPLMRQKMLELSRQRLLAKIERQRGSRVILIVHRQETMALLTQGTWTHDYGITYEAAKAFGLPVTADMPNEVLRLMSLFPQPKRQGVEYLPVPYRYKEPTPPGSR